jgi:hypothetical protein
MWLSGDDHDDRGAGDGGRVYFLCVETRWSSGMRELHASPQRGLLTFTTPCRPGGQVGARGMLSGCTARW